MIRFAHYTDEATPRLVRCFLATTAGPLHGYSAAAARNKELFHRLGKVLLRCMALDLGYKPGTFAVRSHFAGKAESGAITLHTDALYVQFSHRPLGNGAQDILYRACQGRQDVTGGRDHFLPFVVLEDYKLALSLLAALKGEARR
jgi:hypothetical protein